MALYKGSIRLAGIGSFPDQIQYMSQDDYNALSEEAKMNGTTYGIVGSGGDDSKQYIDSIVRLATDSPLSSGDITSGTPITIPDGANFVLLLVYYYTNARGMVFTIPVEFIKNHYDGKPGTAGDMSSNYSGAYFGAYDSTNNTITPYLDSVSAKYYFY